MIFFILKSINFSPECAGFTVGIGFVVNMLWQADDFELIGYDGLIVVALKGNSNAPSAINLM